MLSADSSTSSTIAAVAEDGEAAIALSGNEEVEPVAPPVVLCLCNLGGLGGAPAMRKSCTGGSSTMSDGEV